MSLCLADALPDGEPQLDQAALQHSECGGLQGVALPNRYVGLGEKWEDRRHTGALPIESVAVVGKQLLDLGVAISGNQVDALPVGRYPCVLRSRGGGMPPRPHSQPHEACESISHYPLVGARNTANGFR
jgi:hypothetical protein